jgi:hypothetical protein
MIEILKGVYSVDHSEAKNHSPETWALNCKEGVVVVDAKMKPDTVDTPASLPYIAFGSGRDIDLSRVKFLLIPEIR